MGAARFAIAARIAASLRHGNWDGAEARVEPFEPDCLAEVVASLSLDWRSEPGGASHTLDLFQEWGGSRHIDLVAFDDFTAAGRRWWDGCDSHDPRTEGHGIVPGAPNRDE